MTACEWAACREVGTTRAAEWLFCDRHARQHEAMEAGDDLDDGDDLTDRQIVDETAVQRRCRGDRTVTLNRAEAFAAFALLEQAGMSAAEIATRLGVTARTVDRWRNGHVVDPYGLPGVVMTTPTPDTIGLLLEQASGHGSPKVQRLAGRIEGLLDDLRGLIKASEAQEETRQEVARLERQLAEAKAKLRGGTVAVRTIAPAREGDKRKEPMDCRKCGKTCSGPQGRFAHERHCQGEAVAS